MCVQNSTSEVTVVAFIVFPTRTNNFNVESLRGQAIAKQLRETISAVQKDIGQRLFEVCLRSPAYRPTCKRIIVSDTRRIYGGEQGGHGGAPKVGSHRVPREARGCTPAPTEGVYSTPLDLRCARGWGRGESCGVRGFLAGVGMNVAGILRRWICQLRDSRGDGFYYGGNPTLNYIRNIMI